jgi:two-component system, OmpR family, response regulator ChvI
MTARSILIVEDDADARDSLRDFFAAHGFTVWGAKDGGCALELLDELSRPPGCILLDLDMPVMNGWEVMERLRQRPAAPPVIVLSADEESPPPGARHYFNKPPSMELLLRAAVSCCLRTAPG